MDSADPRVASMEYAVERLKRCGFVLAQASMKSEACYYCWPGRDGVLRVALHRYSRTKDRAMTQPVLSCLTFGQGADPYDRGLDHRIASAIGRYFMGDGSGTANWRASQRAV